MPPTSQLASYPSALLEHFASEVHPTQRSAFLQSQPALDSPHAARALCELANQLARSDLHSARKAADAAVWVAARHSDKSTTGVTHRTRGNILESLAQYQGAFRDYETAIDLFKAADDDHQAAITRSSAISTITNVKGTQAALAWAEQAKQVFRRYGDQLRLARLENNIATVYYRQEHYEKALTHWNLAYNAFQDVGEVYDTAIALKNLAVCHISLNQPARARKFYSLTRSLCVDHNLEVLLHDVEYNIAYLHYLQGDHHTALGLYRDARLRCKQLGDTYLEALCSLDESDIYIELNLLTEAKTVAHLANQQFTRIGRSYEAAKASFNLAVVAFRQEQPRAALRLLEEANPTFEREANRLWPGQINLFRAVVLYSEGRYFEALRYADLARSRFASARLHRHNSLTALLLAKVALARGFPAEAEELCRSALSQLLQSGEPDSVFQVLLVLADTLEQQQRANEALRILRGAERRLGEIRSRRGAALMRVSLIPDRLVIYEDLITLAMHGSELGDLSEAFAWMERAKTRSFADLLLTRASSDAPSIRSQLVEQVSELRQELTWLYRRIDRTDSRHSPPTESVVRELLQQSQDKENELAQILARVAETSAGTQLALGNLQIAELRQVQRSLGKGLLVEYFLAHDTILALVVSQAAAQLTPVAVAPRVLELQKRLWFQLGKTSDSTGSTSSKRLIDSLLSDLYVELLSPLGASLDAPFVVFVPHGFLHYLPFHALRTENRYLIDQLPISYCPSGTLFHTVRSRPTRKSSTLLSLTHEDTRDCDYTPPFPAGCMQSVACCDSRTERSVLQALLDAPQLAIHLKTQARFRIDNPLFSTLKVANEERTLLDLHQSTLPCEMVTVEGAGAALSSTGRGEETLALWRALLAAGARSAVLPLWRTGTDSDDLFSRRFYSELLDGTPRSTAMQRAVLAMVKAGTPFRHWAGRVLVGEPSSPLVDG